MLAAVGTVGTDDGVSIAVQLIDRRSGQSSASAELRVSTADGASILVNPTFAGSTGTLCIVLSISEPKSTGMVKKVDPTTGQSFELEGRSWTTHHELVYFDGNKASFAGPFVIDDAPSLANVNVGASDEDLFLWTINEPAHVVTEKGSSIEPVAVLSVYPIGTGDARASMAAPGPWPVNGEPIVSLENDRVARLIDGTTFQDYSIGTGVIQHFRIESLDRVGSKPSPAWAERLSDGTPFVSAPGVGVAAIIDPADRYRTQGLLTYERAEYALGAPDRKAFVSGPTTTMYVLGSKDVGGLAAYDLLTGKQLFSWGGQHFSGITRIGDDSLLAVSPESPQLSIFDLSLRPIAITEVNIDVVAIY
jgi:hypothetical protein